MPLYGHEMNDEISPKEAGLGMFVKMDQEDFIGKAALLKREPLTRRRTGLKAVGRGIIREGQDVWYQDQKVGVPPPEPIALTWVSGGYGLNQPAVSRAWNPVGSGRPRTEGSRPGCTTAFL